jgi:AcrR family transcriptional regulator
LNLTRRIYRLALVPQLRAVRKAKKPVRVRLAPDARRQQLVAVASKLLTEQGPAHLQIKELAAVAGVTRPVVYRFFPTRLALVESVLDDFVARLAARYHAALVASMGAPVAESAQAFIEASCDAIADGGVGAWRLMYARGSDVEAARLGQAALARLLAPWLPRIVELTGMDTRTVETVASIIVAAGGAALDPWIDGEARRKDAVRAATRSVTALLVEWAKP